MAYWDLGMKHIVDVDGQLLAIHADVIDTARLLERARLSEDFQLVMLRAGERILLGSRQLIRLSQDEVLFFQTDQRAARQHDWLLAA